MFRKAKDKLAEVQQNRALTSATRRGYVDTLGTLDWLNTTGDILEGLKDTRAEAKLSGKDLAKLQSTTFLRCAGEALEDDVLTAEEESRLAALADALDIQQAQLTTPEYFPTWYRVIIASVNDGRLPTLDASEYRLLTRAGERVHTTGSAELIKAVDVKQWQGGSSGFSFRVAKGVTYRTGKTRGQLVTVGSKTITEDTGTLTVTSHRVVFSGNKKSLEFAYPKLLDISIYSDGIRLAVSNRQTPSVFRLNTPELTAAIINGAMQ